MPLATFHVTVYAVTDMRTNRVHKIVVEGGKKIHDSNLYLRHREDPECLHVISEFERFREKIQSTHKAFDKFDEDIIGHAGSPKNKGLSAMDGYGTKHESLDK